MYVLTVVTNYKSVGNPELICCCRKRSEFCVSLWKARYLQHNAAIRAIVPQEQLLVHKVKVCNARNMENPNLYDIGWWWLGATVQFLGQTYPWQSMASWKQVPGPILIYSKQSVKYVLTPQGRERQGKHCSQVRRVWSFPERKLWGCHLSSLLDIPSCRDCNCMLLKEILD